MPGSSEWVVALAESHVSECEQWVSRLCLHPCERYAAQAGASHAAACCLAACMQNISPPMATIGSRHQLPLTCQVRWPNRQANLRLVRSSIDWNVLMSCDKSMLLGSTRRHKVFLSHGAQRTLNFVCTSGTTTGTIASGIMNAATTS